MNATNSASATAGKSSVRTRFEGWALLRYRDPRRGSREAAGRAGVFLKVNNEVELETDLVFAKE